MLPVLPVKLYRLPFARLDLRNHRKLAVIDGIVALTGSQNIVEATYGQKRAGAGATSWSALPAPRFGSCKASSWKTGSTSRASCWTTAALFPPCQADGSIAVQVVPTGPDLPTEPFQELVVKTIFLARRRVVITSPYFVPDEAMLLALRLAALRGVQVDLVIPERSDHWLVDLAGGFYCLYLMRFGVNVRLFREGMLHAKTLTVDDSIGHLRLGQLRYSLLHAELRVEPVGVCQPKRWTSCTVCSRAFWPIRDRQCRRLVARTPSGAGSN